MTQDIFFIDGARTPFGSFGGTLKDMTATDVAVVAAKAALERSKVSPDQVEHVVFGNVSQTAADAIYLARHVGLKSGVPIPVPALTVQRLCGSGFQAVVSGAQEILTDGIGLCLVGGTESMSQSPHVIRGARWGIALGKGQLEDTLWQGLTDPYCGCPMAITAENLAEKYGISREDSDQWAYTSQMRTKAAAEACRLSAEIVAVEVPGKRETVRFDKDEHPRFDASVEKMAKLPAVFKKGGVVTAGNASGISDGAAAMVIASGSKVKDLGLKPIGRLVSWATVGVPPEIMGIGPVDACRQALKKAGLTLEQMDLVEINEAFAPQVLACVKELGVDKAKLNVNGGAIALGHPLGASGARLTLTILYELRRRKARYGLASACIGGGQGIALVVEAVSE
ncbi:MAG TPA: acetyl-CoA C-acetyltransferase [Candidatus Xenobia bacterium]|jgi:acetyl-CoA acyltransferase 2